jgi:hypothetical protein
MTLTTVNKKPLQNNFRVSILGFGWILFHPNKLDLKIFRLGSNIYKLGAKS